MNELALFAGAGGGILGGHLLGWRTICAVEWEPYAACVLAARQNDGILPPFPIWDDVQTFDGKPWSGRVDVISGGFPCQDISAAGKGAGIDGERSGMWSHMARIVGEVRPRYVYVENSPMLTSRGLHRVLGDLAEMGFDARWGVVSASDVGAPHQRDRIWIVAYSNGIGDALRGNATDHEEELARRQIDARRSECDSGQGRSQSTRKSLVVANSSQIGLGTASTNRKLGGNQRFAVGSLDCQWWNAEPGQTSREIEPYVGRVAHGVAARVDRLKAIGNGQVPAVAATAFRLLGG